MDIVVSMDNHVNEWTPRSLHQRLGFTESHI